MNDDSVKPQAHHVPHEPHDQSSSEGPLAGDTTPAYDATPEPDDDPTDASPSPESEATSEASSSPEAETALATAEAPPIPSYLLDPRPPVIIGTVAWTLALLAHMLFFDGDMRTVILCGVGVGVGAFGTAIYALQRRAVLRGAKGAQVGLYFDVRE